MPRGPSLRIPGVSRPIDGGDMLDFVRRVGADPIDVDVSFAGVTASTAPHLLGRRYIGGIIIGVSAAHASDISVSTPEAAQTAGVDVTKFVRVLTSTAFTGTVRVRML